MVIRRHQRMTFGRLALTASSRREGKHVGNGLTPFHRHARHRADLGAGGGAGTRLCGPDLGRKARQQGQQGDEQAVRHIGQIGAGLALVQPERPGAADLPPNRAIFGGN